MKHMVILVCSPGAEDPEVRMIENTLEECQKVVGGRIEIALTSQSFPKDILVICNAEGLLEDLPPNRFGIRGTFFCCRRNGEEFDSLTPRQIVFLKKYLESTGW